MASWSSVVGEHSASRDAEVEDLHDAVFAHHDVLGFHVPMDDAHVVRGLEVRARCRRASARGEEGKVRRADETPERRADDVLHREVEATLRLTDVIDATTTFGWLNEATARASRSRRLVHLAREARRVRRPAWRRVRPSGRR